MLYILQTQASKPAQGATASPLMGKKNRIKILQTMIKEPKNIDFYTTGNQPSVQDFMRISEWIRKRKLKNLGTKAKNKKPA